MPGFRYKMGAVPSPFILNDLGVIVFVDGRGDVFRFS
jgi:hypothetical protein